MKLKILAFLVFFAFIILEGFSQKSSSCPPLYDNPEDPASPENPNWKYNTNYIWNGAPGENCRTQETPGANGYSKSQCTMWAYYRTGFTGQGNAGHWDDDLPTKEAPRDMNASYIDKIPAPGTLMIWQPVPIDPAKGTETAGHVAVVECVDNVNRPPRWIEISEYNSDYNPCGFNKRRLEASAWAPEKNINFIYVNGKAWENTLDCTSPAVISGAKAEALNEDATKVNVSLTLEAPVCALLSYELHRTFRNQGIQKTEIFQVTEDQLSNGFNDVIEADPCSIIQYDFYKIFNLLGLKFYAPPYKLHVESLSQPKDVNISFQETGTLYTDTYFSIGKTCPELSPTFIVECMATGQNPLLGNLLKNGSFYFNLKRGIQYKYTVKAAKYIGNGISFSVAKEGFFETPYPLHPDRIPVPFKPQASLEDCHFKITWEPLTFPESLDYTILVSRFIPQTKKYETLETITAEAGKSIVYYSPADDKDGTYAFSLKVSKPGTTEFQISDSMKVARDCNYEVPSFELSTAECKGIRIDVSFPGLDPGKKLRRVLAYRKRSATAAYDPDPLIIMIDDTFKGFVYDEDVQNETEVFYRLKAVYADDQKKEIESAFTNEKSRRASAPPLCPSDVRISLIDKEMKLNFLDRSNDETGFEIEGLTSWTDQNGFWQNLLPKEEWGNSVQEKFTPYPFNYDYLYFLKIRAVKGDCKVDDRYATLYKNVVALRPPVFFQVQLAKAGDSENQYTLSWTSWSKHTEYFEIFRKTMDEENWSNEPVLKIPTNGKTGPFTAAILGTTGKIFQYRIRGMYTNFPDPLNTAITDIFYSSMIGPVSAPVPLHECKDLAVPKNVTGTITDPMSGTVQLNWEYSPGAEQGFYIQYRRNLNDNFTTLKSAALNSRSAEVILPDFTNYVNKGNVQFLFNIRAYNETCVSSQSNLVTLYTLAPPSKPGVIFNSIKNTASISWLKLTTLNEMFEAEYSQDEGKTWLPAGTTYNLNYEIPVLINTGYLFRVRAIMSNSTGLAGASGWMVSDPVILQKLPETPGNVISKVLDASVLLSWNEAQLADRYAILRYSDDMHAWETIGETLAGNTSFMDPGPLPSGIYKYRISAINGGGERASEITQQIILDTPSNTVVKVRNKSVYISWDPVLSATQYIVEKFNGLFPDKGSWIVVDTTDSDFFASGDQTPDDYYYRIKAVAALGKEGSSAYTEALKASVLAIPLHFTASVSGTSILLKWDAVSGATAYQLEQYFSISTQYDETAWQIVQNDIESNSYVFTPSGNGPFKFRLKALNMTGESAYTDAINTTQPENLFAVVIQNSIQLSWLPTDGTAEYFVQRFGGVYPDKGSWQDIQTTNALSFTDAALTPGTYYYRVRLNSSDFFTTIASGTILGPDMLREPENPINTVPGVYYAYYEAPVDQKWNQLPDFNFMTPVRTGTVNNFTLTERNSAVSFAFRFDGYIDIPADGIYTFYTISDDGSKLYIGNTEVVNNDGWHISQERSGSIGLKKGKHSIRVSYHQRDGSQVFYVFYRAGEAGTRASIPDEILYRIETPSVNARMEMPDPTSAGISAYTDAVKVFPNPAKGYIRIDLQSEQSTSINIRITDFLGSEFLHQVRYVTQGSNELKLSLPPMENGVYIVILEKDGMIKREKIMILN